MAARLLASGRLHATSSLFGVLPSGARVDRITLANAAGVSVDVMTYGATVLSVKVPSKATGPEEVTLNYADLETFRAKSSYYGSTIGRVGNRIAGGKFAVGDKSYQLATNNGSNALHGGVVGWDKVNWSPRVYASEGAVGVELTYTSHDGEEGYPGTVLASADYRLTSDNELVMVFSATTDKATPINMCNHAYWNLSGGLASDIKGHTLQLNTPYVLRNNSVQIPTGVVPVAGTAFDFLTPKTVGSRLFEVDGGGEPGYDHNYCRVAEGAVPEGSKYPMDVIAVLADPASGRSMTVSTDCPGVQLYTGNWLSKSAGDAPHVQHRALCLETQNYPNAVNTPGFPEAVLQPGQQYCVTTAHKFAW